MNFGGIHELHLLLQISDTPAQVQVSREAAMSPSCQQFLSSHVYRPLPPVPLSAPAPEIALTSACIVHH
jgi:hypothetical protein